MAIELRAPEDDDWPAMCAVDGRAFGEAFTTEEIAKMTAIHDLSRFRVALDAGTIVAIAGSDAFDVTLPGGTTMPMGGVTWVSTAATHRRQGLMRRVVEAVHDDIDDRGEPLATLYASEGGIYEHLGYGIATHVRVTSIDVRRARIRAEFRTPSGSVRFIDGDDVVPHACEVWDRFRRLRPGEVSRTPELHDFVFDMRSRPDGKLSPAYYLAHPDGLATYRIEQDWNNGHPQHALHLAEFSAVTPDAHAALWQTLLDIDLVGTVKSRILAPDEPLPFLLENQRALRTVELNDGVWVNVRDIGIAFGNRTYRTTDRIVVEADGKRWAVDGGPEGATCKAVKTRPDLVTSKGWLSSLLYGGMRPSLLVAGGRMTARNDDVVRRADLFFVSEPTPHCQTMY